MRTRDATPQATHLVHHDDLEGLGLLGLPNCNLPLHRKNVPQSRNEGLERIASRARRSRRHGRPWRRRRRRRSLSQPSHKHDRRELREQLRRVGVHRSTSIMQQPRRSI
jgi:hypothetical protein